jgi:hypothetical protein
MVVGQRLGPRRCRQAWLVRPGGTRSQAPPAATDSSVTARAGAQVSDGSRGVVRPSPHLTSDEVDLRIVGRGAARCGAVCVVEVGQRVGTASRPGQPRLPGFPARLTHMLSQQRTEPHARRLRQRYRNEVPPRHRDLPSSQVGAALSCSTTNTLRLREVRDEEARTPCTNGKRGLLRALGVPLAAVNHGKSPPSAVTGLLQDPSWPRSRRGPSR